MDFNTIKNKRKLEKIEGKNLGTKSPIYCVIDLFKNYCSGHNDFPLLTNLKSKPYSHGFIDENEIDENRSFSTSAESMIKPCEVTEIYVDHYVAFFLTSESAHEYLKRQAHNLSDEAYVYVHSEGYSNNQFFKLFDNED